jgi:hypothetical protein
VALVDLCPEHVRTCGPRQAVDAVRADHEVVSGAKVIELRGELPVADADAELLAPLAQDRQQAPPADRRETVAARSLHLALEVDVDVVPDREVLAQALEEGGVGVLDPAERLVGEDNAEAERVVGGVPLPDVDLVLRVEQLDERRQVETRGSTADDCDSQSRDSRSRNLWSFPVAVLGRDSANSTMRGYL